MKRKYRISIAVLLAIVLVLAAAGAWAAPEFQGTVPPIGTTQSGDKDHPINLGPLTVTTTGTCTMTATIENPSFLAPAPTGKVIISATFQLELSATCPVTISYAYPPAFADKNAKIYKLNTAVTPNVWVEVPSKVNPD